uniref:Uncharacterized protein n=1 Tax=Oryza nivara TaxID=4536 RepID=A0A0E0IPZ6_ORYNI
MPASVTRAPWQECGHRRWPNPPTSVAGSLSCRCGSALRASHRRTLLHLEQQVVTHSTAGDALRVGTARGVGGLDFFVSRSHSARLIDLVTLLSPTRVVASKQLCAATEKERKR